MTGIICLWSGTIASIPDGWSLCDGSNGTPNMRGRFVRGSGTGVGGGGSGGSYCHQHCVSGTTAICDTSHEHGVNIESCGPGSDGCNVIDDDGDYQSYDVHTHLVYGCTDDCEWVHAHSFSEVADICVTMPPFVYLLFIMKD